MTLPDIGTDSIREWNQWLRDAGVITSEEGELIRRIIIDIPLEDKVKVYIERYGFEGADVPSPSKITPTMIAGMEVRVVG